MSEGLFRLHLWLMHESAGNLQHLGSQHVPLQMLCSDPFCCKGVMWTASAAFEQEPHHTPSIFGCDLQFTSWDSLLVRAFSVCIQTFGISCYVSDVTQQVTGSSLSGNMLNFQASMSGNGQRFSASQMRLWHSPCQRTPLGCNLVSLVSACRLTGLGLGTPSRYPARTISWNACKVL